jgi:hypothetical protein
MDPVLLKPNEFYKSCVDNTKSINITLFVTRGHFGIDVTTGNIHYACLNKYDD